MDKEQNKLISNFQQYQETQNKVTKSPFFKADHIQRDNHNHNNKQLVRQNNQSRVSRISRYSNMHNSQDMMNLEKLSQLSERLKNIHHFYKIRIQEEKSKSSQRNQVFMGIIQQLQKNHNEKIKAIQMQIKVAQEQKNDVGFVDQRMNEIKGSVQQILKQSTYLKNANQALERNIIEKEQILTQKQSQCAKLNKQMVQFRDQLEAFERMKLKETKKNRQMLEMIDNVINTVR